MDRSAVSASGVLARQAFMPRVFGWMAVALSVSAIAAQATVSSPVALSLVFGNRWVLIGLILVELGLVLAISAALHKITPFAAKILFLLYAALNGVTLSSVLLRYASASVTSAFVVAAAMFLASSALGAVTKRDLSGFGNFLMMGLFGILIASFVNMFLASETVYWAATYISVFVFAGLAAYDTQRIRAMGVGTAGLSAGVAEKAAVIGALALYLDFVNLFLSLLRIFGRGRD